MRRQIYPSMKSQNNDEKKNVLEEINVQNPQK